MDVSQYILKTEQELEKCCDEFFYADSEVARAARYSLLNAGKRTRAILIYLTSRMCGQNWQDYLRLGAGVEMIHCYSLIHDDLPCMDDDDYRRGKPSCHKVFGEATALLAGDALAGCGLQAMINAPFSDSERVKAVMAATEAMGPKGMIYGQELDLRYENRPADKLTLNNIHRHKTGRMISLCGLLGSIKSDITDTQAERLKMFFDNIGLVFQIVDDILDVEGDARLLGKPTGSDEGKNKSTFVSLYGLEQSKEIARQLTSQAEKAVREAFGDRAEQLVEYTTYLLNRKK